LRSDGRRKIPCPDIRASEFNLVEAGYFDIDGTLVDSRNLIVESNRIVFRSVRFCAAPDEGDFALRGNVTGNLFSRNWRG